MARPNDVFVQEFPLWAHIEQQASLGDKLLNLSS